MPTWTDKVAAQDPRFGGVIMEAPGTVIAKATQITDQLAPNCNVRTAEVSKTTPDVVGPLDLRKSRPRETREFRLTQHFPAR